MFYLLFFCFVLNMTQKRFSPSLSLDNQKKEHEK
nr:MAG TPA: hypothetical protein [Caudoviricetes sp.]